MRSFSSFKPKYHGDCLKIFDSNLEPFFAPNERELFAACLKDKEEMKYYYVLETEGVIAACGGFIHTAKDIVELSWGMVRRNMHRKGLGRALLEYRLKRISEIFPPSKVRIGTSQHSEPFFSRYGFETIKTQVDGFGPGLNQVTMIRKSKQSLKGIPSPKALHS